MGGTKDTGSVSQKSRACLPGMRKMVHPMGLRKQRLPGSPAWAALQTQGSRSEASGSKEVATASAIHEGGRGLPEGGKGGLTFC